MAQQPLRDLTKPKKTSDAVTKKYVDDLIVDNVGNIKGAGGSPFFKENGNYQAMHAINMAFKKLLNLSTPSEPFEATTKEYADKRPHIIVVHTHYCGNLRRGEYQFSFGGNVGSKLDTGFLVLQSSRLKKILTKISHEGKDSSRNIFEGGSIFTIIAIRYTGEPSDLLTYECFISDRSLSGDDGYDKKCGFDRDPENISISEGDVINIRTEKDYSEADHRGIDIPISYLFTFLLELDPL